MKMIGRRCGAVLFTLFLLVMGLGSNALALPSGITCPTKTKPAGGWPLVFLFNGNCFKSVSGGSLAGDAQTQLNATGKVCTAVVSHSDLVHASDIDAMIRNKVIPLIKKNLSYVNPQKIGGLGFSAGGTVVSYLGTKWAKGIDPATGTNNNFRVGAVVNFYGPLRMDRSTATDGAGNDLGGGGLFYLHENRSHDTNVDIPGIRQWDNQNCFCAGRGTSPCQCDVASTTYLNAYLTAYNTDPSTRICSFYSDEPNLISMSPTCYIEDYNPSHVAAMYLCSGWKDSNVDYDQNLHQAVSWWQPQYLTTVTADDGHGFPLSVCNSAADAQGVTRPLTWLTNMLNVLGDFPPITR